MKHKAGVVIRGLTFLVISTVTLGPIGYGADEPFNVVSEAALTLGGWGTSLGNHNNADNSGSDDFNCFTTKTLPAAFPKGYQDFYVMKYEMSQGQYRDFLNTLTAAQKAKRTATMTATKYVMSNTDTVSDRNGLYTADGSTIVCDFDDDGTGNESNDGEWIAMNYLSWMDLCAYADWAGLRPMTELEFEKACRGTTSAVYGEYAWGSTDIFIAQDPANEGATNEYVGRSENGVCVYQSAVSLQGPVRVGGVAYGSDGNRTTSGGTAYGLMEMSGNVSERAVTVGHATGRAFTGTHGDGTLTTTTSHEGNATNTDWPGIDAITARGVTGAAGSGFRGGDWSGSASYARTSARGIAAFGSTDRGDTGGGRLVRTAP